MTKKNCYFIVEKSEINGKEKMTPLCLKCRDEKFPDRGWYWEGKKNGYGPFLIKCKYCQEIIHDPKSKGEL